MTAPRIWGYRPTAALGWPIGHGSDEWGRCTLVLGFPWTGQIVIPYRKHHLFHDRRADRLFLQVAHTHPDGSVLTSQPHPQVHIETDDLGQLVGVVVRLPERFEGWKAVDQ